MSIYFHWKMSKIRLWCLCIYSNELFHSKNHLRLLLACDNVKVKRVLFYASSLICIKSFFCGLVKVPCLTVIADTDSWSVWLSLNCYLWTWRIICVNPAHRRPGIYPCRDHRSPPTQSTHWTQAPSPTHTGTPAEKHHVVKAQVERFYFIMEHN